MPTNATSDSLPVLIERPIAVRLGLVSANLPRDRRWCTIQRRRDLAQAQTFASHVANQNPLVLGEEPIADQSRLKPIQRRRDPDSLAILVSLVPTVPVLCRRPGNGDLFRESHKTPPQARNSANLARFADWGRRPGPFFTRRDDLSNTTPAAQECCNDHAKPPVARRGRQRCPGELLVAATNVSNQHRRNTWQDQRPLARTYATPPRRSVRRGGVLYVQAPTTRAVVCAARLSSAAFSAWAWVIATSVRSRQSRISWPKNGKPVLPVASKRYWPSWFTSST